MKKMKKILALLLCLTMAISGPLSVFAEETDITIEETVTEEEKSSVCEICQQEPCVCVAKEIEESEETAQVCENCQQEPCVCVSEEAGKSEETAQVCGICQQEPCVCVAEEIEKSEETAQVCENCQQEPCICNQANAVSENEDSKPQVGDEIWIKHGSKVYKSQSENNGWSLWGNYKVKIVNIIADENNNAIWYEFRFTSLGIGEYLLKEYKYVQAENTSVEKPKETESIDKHVCNCGENAPENIADHADSCPRKAYIKTLFDGKSAEEIYANWGNYDEAIRNDILNMLRKWDNKKYEELKKLVDEAPEGEKETTVGDISLKVQGVPEDVTLDAKTVAPKSWDEAVFEAVGNKKVVFAIDITLNGEEGQWQPAEGEPVTVSLDAASLGLSEGERIGILHDHEGELNDLGICTVTDGKLTFTTNGFSVFYGYTVDFEYDGTWYSIGGGGIILLSELFDALNIEKSVQDVSIVEFSNPTLLSVSYENVGSYVPEYDWILRSLEPFNTEEVLTVNFTSGEVLQIKVLDADYTVLTDGMTLNNGDALNGNISVAGNTTITVNGTVTLNGNITVQGNATLTINGSGTIKRGSSNRGAMFTVANGGKLIVNAITIDGAASWTATNIASSTRKTLSVSDVQAEHTAIYSAGGATITLNGTTMQNLYTTKNSAAIHTLGTVGNANNIPPSNVTLTNVNVKNCASTSDNSILLLNYSYATLTGCIVENNYAGNRYAGVIKAGGPSNFCLLKMNGCTATNNYSSGWGGVILWAANTAYNGTRTEAFITECTFTNNTARYLGGAISNEAIMTVSGCTITGNTAMSGGGIATFPYTRTEEDATGSNACGLTLGAGNIISNNKAVATGKFKPFSSGGDGADQDAPETMITNVIEYTGGGGGVWCYMNKVNWTCSLEIGNGNTIEENNAENMGGGVLVEHVAGNYTELKVTGAEIKGNNTKLGGGVAVIKATVSIDSGEITGNTASANGGGIYVTNGICNVSGIGSVSENGAANGGGIYIDSGKLTVNGGIITKNKANGQCTVDKQVIGETAYNLQAGVGGGIYVKTGSFVMSGEADLIGIYGNLADFAADDAYASGSNTALTLPDVTNMKLAEAYQSAEGWFADYVSGDTYYNSMKPFEFANNGRYRTTGNVDNPTGAINGNAYYCVTLGRIPSLVITKILDSDKQPDHSFIFEVEKPDNTIIKVVIPSNAFELVNGKMQASVTITKLITGQYTVQEIADWSWRYQFESAETKKDLNFSTITNGVVFNLSADGEEAIFKNNRTKPSWLSGDSYCENWWGGTAEGKTIEKRNEKNEIIHE